MFAKISLTTILILPLEWIFNDSIISQLVFNYSTISHDFQSSDHFSGVEESLAERTTQLQATEDKLNALNKSKNKTEGTLKENEFNLQKEKDAKAKVEKEKRKLEGEIIIQLFGLSKTHTCLYAPIKVHQLEAGVNPDNDFITIRQRSAR